ncbi:AAA family ATPase [Exilibacterium tricleocarpae]|nr:AAA family ATPase [Exilibacterium tricleocarpae]
MLETRVPLVVIETYEEKRALDLLLKVAQRQRSPLFRWSLTDGLSRMSFGLQIQRESENCEPAAVLEHIKRQVEAGVFALCDLHPFMDDHPKHIRLIKDIVLNHKNVPHTLVLISHRLSLPPELARYSASLQLRLPDEKEILALIREEAKQWSAAKGGGRIKTDNRTLQQLVANLKGLTHAEVRRLARGAIVDDGAITESDLPAVNKAKFALMDMEGVLTFEYQTETFAGVGGLVHLKNWLAERRQVFLNPQGQGLDCPKGILLLGVQGGGKSLAAKAVAGLWGLPLLRLDMGMVYNKYVGETERNLREALKLAELMAPCVLWLDELEKGMTQGDGDNGTSRRLLGTLLTWMAESRPSVFLVATSNDISGLPPELVRKGRFDEIFFVDLPDARVRQDIFAIHLGKRELQADGFDLPALADLSEGFSGAEIEQAVVAALYSAAARGEAVTDAHLAEQLSKTNPLSVVMAEKISALRHWARDRAVMAG